MMQNNNNTEDINLQHQHLFCGQMKNVFKNLLEYIVINITSLSI